MRMIPRYVLLDVLRTFLVALTALTSLMLIVGLVKEAVDQKLPVQQIIQLIPYILPDALRFTVPATMLLAATSVYGRMSGSNEVVALKSQGVHPMTILWPTFVLAFFVSLAAVWLNDLAVSWGRDGVRRVVLEAVEEIAYNMLKTQRSYSSERFSIIVKRVEGRRLIQPTITFSQRGGGPPATLTAEEAILRSDKEAKVLLIACRNGTLDVPGKVSLRFEDVIERPIPLEDASRSRDESMLPAHIPLRLIDSQSREQLERIAQLEEEIAEDATLKWLQGDVQGVTSEGWAERLKNLQDARYHYFRLITEPWRRWSNGFSCLFFVLVGAPLAIHKRNAEFLKVFFLCFLPILIVYYPLLAWGVDRSKGGELHPSCVWLGNLILAVWGWLILRKVIRY